MQDLYRAAHDPVIHCRMDFSDRLDVTALIRAVDLSIHAVPQIACRFDPLSHSWRSCGLSAKEMLQVVAGQNVPAVPDSMLLSPVDFERGPQLRLFVAHRVTGDSLCVIMSHLVADGVGFKQYLYLLADLYSRCAQDPEYAEKPEAGDRGLGQLLKGYSLQEKLSVLLTPVKPFKEDPAMFLPLTGDQDRSFVVVCRLEREQFDRVRAFGRDSGASVNDLLMTSFVRTLYARTGCRKIALPCPVDVRRFLKDPEGCGICNLSSSYVCRAEIREGEPFEKTLRGVSAQMSAQKGSLACVKALVLLDTLSHALPYPIFRRSFYRFFTIPVISYTNLGVLDEKRLRFHGTEVENVSFATAVKSVPYFQVSVSTWKGCCTLSSSLHGTPADQELITGFLEDMKQGLLSAADKDEGRH